jgi:hypothetical protein
VINEKSKKNLKPFKKGHDERRGGKPKGAISAKTVITKWLSVQRKSYDSLNNEDAILTVLDEITLSLIMKAKKGDVAAFNALLDRKEGKPIQTLANDKDNPLIPPSTFKLPDGTDVHI